MTDTTEADNKCWTCRWFAGLSGESFSHGICHVPAASLPVWVRPQFKRFVYRSETCSMHEVGIYAE